MRIGGDAIGRESPSVPEPPVGWQRLAWLGPGFLWMVSAAGSGELLFTPRVGALYGYQLLWALLIAVSLKWFVNREIGRYAVCTGENLVRGFARLPGPRGWAVWAIVVPQVAVAVATIAGLAGSAATALVLVLPGDLRIWTTGAVAGSTALVIWGRYAGVERVAVAIAVALGLASVAAAVSVGPDISAMGSGLRPRVPSEVDIGEILPWLGFMLSGAAGMIWYSFWVIAKGYGAPAGASTDGQNGAEREQRLRGWLRQMTLDNSVAVIGTLVLAVAFLILGTELLRPAGLVPEEEKIAEVLGRLLGDVWERVGFWFMVLAIFVGFWDTVLSDQDGFGRMFESGARHFQSALRLPTSWLRTDRLRNSIVVILLGVIPLILYLVVREPVGLLKLAGAIEAVHIPLVAGLTLYLNRRQLPEALRPGKVATTGTILASVFFLAFAAYFLVDIV
ncbi:MAG: Nramp family divalent metal transporter [Actinomycetota bacterium]